MSIVKLKPIIKNDLEKKISNSNNVSLQRLYRDVLIKDFSKHGRKVVRVLRKEKPEQYLRIIAQVIPMEEKSQEETNHGDQMTDEQLFEIIRSLEEELHLFKDPQEKNLPS